MSEPTFTAPGPGCWTLNVTHCTRPLTYVANELFEGVYTAGFRAGFARYGALLDTLEYRAIAAYPYSAVRPLGAPPGAKGPPPRLLFMLLLHLHPQLRKRRARAAQVFAERTWRLDRDEFFDEHLPRNEALLRKMTAEDIASLDDSALAEHLDRVWIATKAMFHDHFSRAPAALLPVGDFIAHAMDWTGCAAGEAVALLRGASPESVSAVVDLDRVAEALSSRPDLRARVEAGGDAAALLDELRQEPDPVAAAVSDWLARHGERLVGGHDLTERRALEVPATLVASLRARLAGPKPKRETDGGLRERVPADRRAAFDELLAEARLNYGLRDARMAIDYWALGLLRRALVEAGGRLVANGRLGALDHVFDVPLADTARSLRSAEHVLDREAAAARAAWRHRSVIADAPLSVGGTPAPPPPAEWIPGAAGRIARALGICIGMMNEPRTTDAKSLTGLGASPGKYTGVARVVMTATDFDRVRPGDVLVAPITTPTHNVVLPLVGAIVTDRGGLLSHPAIISREYGIPAVVGARGATSTIEDGARVEVDGDRGTVRVVS